MSSSERACPFCEAGPGRPCVTINGEPRTLHFTRQLRAEGKLLTPVTTQRALLSWLSGVVGNQP